MQVWKITQEQKALLISQVQTYFEVERSEEIGQLAAGNLLDFMLRQLGPIVYNQAIGDARTLILQQMAQIEDETYALEKPFQSARIDMTSDRC